MAGCAILFLLLAPATHAQTTWGSPFGANLQLWLESNRAPAVLTPMMDLAEEAGIEWNRDGFTWHVMEPQQGVWDFAATDAAVLACYQRGMRVIGILGFGNPAYGYTGVYTAPQTQAQRDAFANYVYTVVDRYKGKVDYWEIWNEPDLPQFLNSSNYLADYTTILSIAAPVIKQANPNAVVMGPATSAEPLQTIQGLINNGAIQYLDAISFHTYSYPASIEATSETRVVSLRNILAQNDINKPLIVTETGFPTHIGSMGLSMKRQAELMVRGYATLLSNDVKVIAGYCFRNMITDTATQWASIARNWGWIWNDLTPKPVFPAMGTMSALLSNRPFLKALPLSTASGAAAPRIKALAFSNASGRETVVLWSYDELYDADKQLLQSRSHHVVINGFAKDTTTSERDRLYDIQGYEHPLNSITGGYALELGPTPVYLTGLDLDHAKLVVQDIGAPAPPAPVEIVTDNTSADAAASGSWSSSTYISGYYGADFVHDGNSGKGSKSFQFAPDLPMAGDYDVYMRWTSAANRTPSVDVEIESAEGVETIMLDQRTGGGAWALVGRYAFNAGTAGSVTIYNEGTSGYVVADAVRFVKPLFGNPPPPSGGSLIPEADTYVWDGAPTTNYGSHATLAVKDASGAGYDRISYLRFSLADLAGSTPRAVLKLTVGSVAADGSGPRTIELRQLADDGWSEGGVTWSNRPSATGALIATFAPTAAGEVWRLDVTSFVNSQLADGKASFVLVQPGSVSRLVSFCSGEDTTKMPVLEFD